jgi:DNA-binding transcriptional regulator YdaS (Cro superfamily)
MFSNHVKKAVDTVGGPTKAANLLGVSGGSIHAWIKARRVANIDHAKKLAQLAGMKVEEVRPV